MNLKQILEKLLPGQAVVIKRHRWEDRASILLMTETGPCRLLDEDAGYARMPIPAEWLVLEDWEDCGPVERIPVEGTLSQTDLKNRGWTPRLIEHWLGGPVKTERMLGSHGRYTLHTYALDTVLQAERNADVQAARDETTARRAARRPSAVEEAEAKQQRAEALRWFGFAKKDVSSGRFTSNAITKALSLCAAYADLADRVKAVQAQAAKNAEAHQAAKAAQQAERAREREAVSLPTHADRTEQPVQPSPRALYAIEQVPRLHIPLRRGARVIVYERTGRPFRIREDHPSMWGSHLLGHEGDLGCYYYYRSATAAEISELEANEQTAQRNTRLDAIKQRIQEAGERPPGPQVVEGDRLHDTQDAYGGGDWFMVTPDWIWYIRNNGADGDDWSRNNVCTGGAGAIGWRIPRDEALARELRRLEIG